MQQTREKDGWTAWEILKRVRKYKEEPNRAENTITEVKKKKQKTLVGINSRLDDIDEWTNKRAGKQEWWESL